MARISEQVEWLNLIDRSGPFLVPAVLEEVFPQGLEKIETPRRQRLRAAYDEWRDAVDEDDPELADLHDVWTRMVIQETLEYEDEVLIPRERLDGRIVYRAPEHGVEISPDFAVRADTGGTRLLIAIHPPETDLEKPLRGDRWTASPAERMTLLCRASEVRIGLVTNGEEWMLVNAPIGSTSGYASWFARLWWQEPVTLKAFVSLLGVGRCFGPSDETLDQLLERSIAFQAEVTDTLGEQVRRAVEVLIQALGRADQDRNGGLLKDVHPAELYEAGLTVMMRLVFILCAEERGLLLLGDPVYDQHYAISTLRARLRADESQYGPEVLERRHDAWSRMLAVFRAVYGGVEHETLRMPALGGSLFDPDRFPFLEGRAKGTSWREEPAFPLPIDNRTVLLLLTALQVLEQRGGAQLLSYRALDVEQIGHVYEGLLEYTVAKLPEVTVGLIGSQKVPHPTIGLDELESLHAKGAKAAATHLADVTGRSATVIENSLKRGGDDGTLIELVQACGGDENLARRLLPFAELIRMDSWGSLLVYQAGSFAVTHGADRRETGTHYTPRLLTEIIVEKTLEPIVYIGPADGKPRDKWRLRPPAELLDLKVCDPAMGSGAFLVEVCRYLAERLVEAWAREEDAGRVVAIDGVIRDSVDDEEPLPKSLDDRLLIAKRLVAERCLYGVDLNPLAVELAKLSIWLVTLAKGRPFGFLDHNLRCGDSLLGIQRLEQLTKLKMNPDDGPYQQRLFGRSIEVAVERAIEQRKRLREVPIRDIRDIEAMTQLDKESRKVLEGPSLVADAFIGEVFRSKGNGNAIESAEGSLAIKADRFLNGDENTGKELLRTAEEALSVDLPVGRPVRRPFHWPLEFPEVFEQGGFDAFVDNPPFGSAIGGRTADADLVREWWGVISPDIATGAYDRANMFIHQAVMKLKPHGTYGFLMPQANLSPGGASALQFFLNTFAPPSHFIVLENPRLFGGANVYVAGIIGIRTKPSEAVCVYAMSRESDRFRILNGDASFLGSAQSWWQWISQLLSTSSAKPRKVNMYSPPLESLEERFRVFAGCATGAAYDLKSLVEDRESGEGLRLVTTGAIDRYVCTWGVSRQKFLKDSYEFPRWPSLACCPKSVDNSGRRQKQPKIILGGLTKTLEGFYDHGAVYGGAVATWIIVLRTANSNASTILLPILEVLINSHVVSWEYCNAYGAQKSPWGGMTIKKKGLESIRFPSEAFYTSKDIADFSKEWNIENDPWEKDPSAEINRLAAIASIQACAKQIDLLRTRNDLSSMYALDEKLQPTISWLYGKSAEEHLEISQWFVERDRLNKPSQMYERQTR